MFNAHCTCGLFWGEVGGSRPGICRVIKGATDGHFDPAADGSDPTFELALGVQ